MALQRRKLFKRRPKTKPSYVDYILTAIIMFAFWMWRHKRTVAAATLVLVISVAGVNVKNRPPAAPASKDLDSIIIDVSKLANITGDPNPEIIRVSKQQTSDLPILQKSKVGDIVLLYYRAKTAVLYRLSSQSIIDTAPFVPPEARVIILNGTADDNKALAARAKLESISNLQIISEKSAVKNTYTKTYSVDLTNRYEAEYAAINNALGSTLQRLRASETPPDADILIIVGTQ